MDQATTPILIRITDIAARALLAGVFVLAAVSKALHPAPFMAVVDMLLATTIELPGDLEPRLLLPASILTICWETLLGLMVLFGIVRRAAACGVALTLVAFSAVLARLLMLPETPSCGCFGAFPRAVEDARSGVLLGLIRNIALLGPAIWLIFRPAGTAGRSCPGAAGSKAGRRATAFSLVETLVIIAVAVVLIAIAFPALRNAGDRGRSIQSLSALRQLLASIDFYASERDGAFPYLGVPGEPERGLVGYSTTGAVPSYFGGHSTFWATALARAGDMEIEALAMNEEISAVKRAEYAMADLIYTTYLLTHGTSADPKYWEPGAVPLVPGDYRSVLRDEVVFPSAKGLLVDVGQEVFDERIADRGWHVGLADGSAAIRTRGSVVHDDLHRPYGAIPWTVLTTPMGLHGRDW